MNCESARLELMECARRGGNAGGLSAHAALLRKLPKPGAGAAGSQQSSERAANSRHSGRATREKAGAMREFDQHRGHVRQARWMWAVSAAAIVVLSVVAVRELAAGMKRLSPRRPCSRSPRASIPRRTFTPAEEAGEEGFIKLPFALPPVPGETFGIVRDPVGTCATCEDGRPGGTGLEWNGGGRCSGGSGRVGAGGAAFER